MRLADTLRDALEAGRLRSPVLIPGDVLEGEGTGITPAAVLVPVVDRPDPGVILTLRPETMRRHAGQISFPGGAADPGDDFPEGTALREASEEVGLDPVAAGVRVVGRLELVDVRVSGFLLVPVVALAAREPVLRPDPREVAAILHVSVDHFLPQAPIEIVEAERDGWRMRYGAFPVGEHRIWGATARVLGQLGAVLGS